MGDEMVKVKVKILSIGGLNVNGVFSPQGSVVEVSEPAAERLTTIEPIEATTDLKAEIKEVKATENKALSTKDTEDKSIEKSE